MWNNRRLTAMFLVIVAHLVPGTAQQPTSGKLEDPPWIKELAAKRIVYSISSMNRVKVRKDLTYKRVDGAELKMDVYSPVRSQRGARRPAIIFIHGGRIPPNLRTTPKDWGVYYLFRATRRRLRFRRRDVQPSFLRLGEFERLAKRCDGPR